MADDRVDSGVERTGEQRPDPAGAAARSMAQLAQQMKDMADRMMSGGLPGWPVPGLMGQGGGARDEGAADPGARTAVAEPRGSGGRGSGAGGPARPGVPGMPPMPATMSARQVQAIVDDIVARRAQVQALITQLDGFDEQLASLETSLQPLLQWLKTWSDLEGAVTDFWTPKPPR